MTVDQHLEADIAWLEGLRRHSLHPAWKDMDATNNARIDRLIARARGCQHDVGLLGRLRAEALGLTLKHGSPHGTDYEQGVNDQGKRWVDQLDAALKAEPLARPVPAPVGGDGARITPAERAALEHIRTLSTGYPARAQQDSAGVVIAQERLLEVLSVVAKLTALAPPPAPESPEGWLLVPREPTDKMLRAACGDKDEHPVIKHLTSEERSGWGVMPLAHWRAMLAAAPPIEPTPEMIDAGAQRLASFGDESVWPDSWSALELASMRNLAERVIRSALLAAAPSSPTPEGWRATEAPNDQTLELAIILYTSRVMHHRCGGMRKDFDRNSLARQYPRADLEDAIGRSEQAFQLLHADAAPPAATNDGRGS